MFLWVWTGTPFATLRAQQYEWGEKVNPLTIEHQVHELARQVSRATSEHPSLNLAPLAALLGAVVLLIGLALLFRRPRLVSTEAMALALSIGLLAVLSENVAPNARILITAFPAVIVFAHYCEHRRYIWLVNASSALLVITSALTYAGHSLTP